MPGVKVIGVAAMDVKARGVAASAEAASPVLICDLDGTILNCNSFPLWILYLMFGRLPELAPSARLILSFRLHKLLLYRRLGRIDHEQLMREVQLAWHSAIQNAADSAADRVPVLLRRRVRPAFEPVLRQIAAGDIDAVLATAAAGEYALPLGRQLGFRYVLATPCRLPGRVSHQGALDQGALNRGGQKLRRVREFLASREWSGRSRVLLTDHIDDLPLLQQCHAVGWFGSAETLARVRAKAKGVRFVHCRWLDAAALSGVIVALSEQARSAAAGAPAEKRSASADSTPA